MIRLPDAPRVLVIGPSWVGDMVMAQSLFRVLQRRYAGSVIDVLAPAWSRPIVAAMPEVRQSIDMPVGHGRLGWRERRALGFRLRGQYDWAIVLPNSFKSALIPWVAGIPVRTGWLGELRFGLLNDWRRLDKAAFPLMVQRFVALADVRGMNAMPRELIPPPSLRVDAALIGRVLDKFGVAREPVAPILALCPGAEFGAAKQWPETHYAAVARDALQRGWQVWLFGSAKDRPVCERIVAEAGAMGAAASTGGPVLRDPVLRDPVLRDPVSRDPVIRDFSGQTSLEEAVALLSRVQRVVSNDSGLMHVAAALERPLVAVYGSTSPDFTPPLLEAARLERTGIDCSPCFKRECPYGHYRCLRELPPERVIAALETLPQGSFTE